MMGPSPSSTSSRATGASLAALVLGLLAVGAVASLHVLRADLDFVYAGTQRHGVWKRGLGEVLSAAEPTTTLLKAKIWPNPVTDRFTITPNDNQAGQPARLEIFDVLGRRRLMLPMVVNEQRAWSSSR